MEILDAWLSGNLFYWVEVGIHHTAILFMNHCLPTLLHGLGDLGALQVGASEYSLT
jgi:hypothetical protein